MKKNTVRSVVFRLCMAALLAMAPAAHAQQLEPLPVPAVSTDTLMKHIVELASDSYQVRLSGTRGHERAMAYVERVLEGYGMKVEEQQFPIECNEIENCKFNIYTPGSKERRYFTLGNEFCCAGMTGRGYVDAQMVFVGYGVDNNIFDEYKGVDVQGKIAVVLTGTPATRKRGRELHATVRQGPHRRAPRRHRPAGHQRKPQLPQLRAPVSHLLR